MDTDDISAANTENLIDQAIDLLNLYGNLSMENLSGTAGSKTVTLTAKQRGAVLEVAKTLYYKSYSPQSSSSVGALSTALTTFEEPATLAQRLGRNLTTRTILRT